LAEYIKDHNKLGKLCRYTGDLRWRVEGVAPPPDPLELAIDHMAFKRRAAYKEKMRERRVMGQAPEPPKSKPEIWGKNKWNASVAAEIAKQANQANWLLQNALAPRNGI
jgi:hypothetical protein